jgi:methyl-accepting chemotaxis protein
MNNKDNLEQINDSIESIADILEVNAETVAKLCAIVADLSDRLNKLESNNKNE